MSSSRMCAPVTPRPPRPCGVHCGSARLEGRWWEDETVMDGIGKLFCAIVQHARARHPAPAPALRRHRASEYLVPWADR